MSNPHVQRPIIVQKFGGSSVATVERLRRVAELVVARKRQGYAMVVVVSAMGDTTDELLALAKSLAREPDRRELDMLLSAGERISMALLAIAIRDLGERAVSLTGSQSGIITTASHSQARIVEVRPFRVEDELEADNVVIVAGFQGVSYRRDVTTLGRGGSDTTAVALAAALGAEACEIYSDVDGVYSADPRVVPEARQLAELGYAEMQELAEHGARVLNSAAVEFAKNAGIALYARKTGAESPGTVIRRDLPTPSSGVRGIAHELRVANASVPSLARGQSYALLSRLAELGAHPKQVHVEPRGEGEALAFVLSLDDVHAEDSVREAVGAAGGDLQSGMGAVSLVGQGITRDLRVLLEAQAELEAARIVPRGLSTSSFRITFLLPSEQVLEAVRRLHLRIGEELGGTEAEV